MITNRSLPAALLAALFFASPLASGLEERTAGAVRYLSGGIGQDEAQAMKEAAGRYNTAMTFTLNSGQYVSDVKVVVKKPDGQEVLATVTEGPMLLMDLPPGSYTVAATLDGRTQTRKVTVGKGRHQKLVLRWPDTGSTG